MTNVICERCADETTEPQKCMGCGKKLCRKCIKSSKKLHKMERIVICKDCWGDMKKRSAFKVAL